MGAADESDPVGRSDSIVSRAKTTQAFLRFYSTLSSTPSSFSHSTTDTISSGSRLFSLFLTPHLLFPFLHPSLASPTFPLVHLVSNFFFFSSHQTRAFETSQCFYTQTTRIPNHLPAVQLRGNRRARLRIREGGPTKKKSTLVRERKKIILE